MIVMNSDTESDEDGETTSSDQPWVEIGDIILTNDHREDLLGGKWLNDYHIRAAQQLIKLEPELQHIGGLQRPILGQKLAFDVVPDEMVQILHSGGNHWITNREHNWCLYPRNREGIRQPQYTTSCTHKEANSFNRAC